MLYFCKNIKFAERWGSAPRPHCLQQLEAPLTDAWIVGSTSFWRDHFGAARFVVALFGIAHFVAGPFWSGPFWCKFLKIIFSFAFFSIFLICKKIFFQSFSVFI